MKQAILILIMILAMGICSCSGNSAEELFETAKLEELQNNPEHARKLYQEILSKHPQSKYAENARERLAELAEHP